MFLLLTPILNLDKSQQSLRYALPAELTHLVEVCSIDFSIHVCTSMYIYLLHSIRIEQLEMNLQLLTIKRTMIYFDLLNCDNRQDHLPLID